MNLRNYFATESIPTGAARSIGVTIYRRDLQTITFLEIQVDLWFVVVFVTIPRLPTTVAI